MPLENTNQKSLDELRAKLRLSTDTSTLNFKDIRYIPIDYESIMELLINRLKVRLPNRWSDFLESNFGMEILEAVAYEASMLAFLVNRYVNEMYLPTAKTIDGVYNLIKLVGYKPKGPIPARTRIKFYLEKPHKQLIRIPPYLPVGTGFYTVSECRLEPGQTETTVYATAGKLVIDKFLTTGILRDKYLLREGPVSFVEAVFVNGEPFFERDFIDSTEDRKVFTVNYSNNFKGSISFGDGNYGENPKEGLQMVVYYNVNSGEKTNIKAFTITTIGEAIKDVDGEVVDVKCINDQSAGGGKDPETPDQIKRNAPSFFRTQYRAVLRQDFKDIIRTLGYEKVTVIDHNIDNNIGIFGVKIAALNNRGEVLSDIEKDEIVKEIERRKIIATQFDIVKPNIIPINLKINIGISPSFIPEIVVSQVRKLLSEYLSLANRTFGDVVSAIDIYSIVNSVEGVTYADQLQLEENRTITVKEDAYPENPDKSPNQVLKIQDSGRFLVKDSYISILDKDNMATIGKIDKIDGEYYTLDRPIKKKIDKDSLVYPFLKLKYDATSEAKEIYIEGQGPLGEISNSVICFMGDARNTEYTVMFRAFAGAGKTGEKFRLTQQLGRNFSAGSLIYIKKKNPLPVLDGNHRLNSDILKFKTTPRFTPGAILIPRKTITYDIETRTLVRNNDTYDNLPSDILIADIRRVYINPTNPFKPDVHYRVNNNRSIVWLDLEAVPANKQYYVDIVKVTSIDRTSDIKYYVSSVSGYACKISPSLSVNLSDGDILDVESDSLNMSELEIADLGNIDIKVTQKPI